MSLKPQKRSFESDLPDFQPILLKILSPVEAVKDIRDPDKENVIFHFQVVSPPWSEKDPPAKTRQQHGNTVNAKSDGTPSLLAQLVNASQRADLSKAELLDFDLETLPGSVVEAIGRVKEDDRGKFWNVVTYRRPTPTTGAQVPSDGYQYTPDGLHRWKPGMAAWEPVPQAAPPPPPAAPPAPIPTSAAAPSVPAAGSPPPPPAPAGEIRF